MADIQLPEPQEIPKPPEAESKLPEPVIQFDNWVALRLMAYAHATTMEFSGFGFVEREGRVLRVYDFVLLNVGSSGYTEIPPAEVANLSFTRPDANKMKVWIHKHPMGNGIPGPHNWSETDRKTCEEEPLGSPAALTKWAAAVVITPKGWVGRIDSFTGGHKVRHVQVLPNLQSMYQEIDALRPKVVVTYTPQYPRIAPLSPPDFPPANYDVYDYYNQSTGTFHATHLPGWDENAGYVDPRYDADFTGAGAYEFGDPEVVLMEMIDEYGPDATLGEVANEFGLSLLPDDIAGPPAAESEDDHESHPTQWDLRRFFDLGWLGRSGRDRRDNRRRPGKDRDRLP